jgi:AcrR family transcriptional regulator
MPRIRAEDLAAHREQAEAQLLDAVGDLLAERGPAAVTVAEVAARAGMARSSAYGYAPDREALLAAYARRQAERLVARAQPLLAAGPDAPARLAALVELLAADLRPVLDLDLPPRALAPVRDLLAEVLAAGGADGSLRAVAPEAAVPLVLACAGADGQGEAPAFVVHALRRVV